MMIDISKGRYWGLPLSLVDGCTPCSPGCDRCWSAAISHHYQRDKIDGLSLYTNMSDGKFSGHIVIHPERLSIPLKRKKATVYAVWNDMFHDVVPDWFRDQTYAMMALCRQHTFLILTKRAENMARYWSVGRVELGTRWYEARKYNRDGTTIAAANCGKWPTAGIPNVYHGLTVCNQQEMESKSKAFFNVPGHKWLSLEPLLSKVIVPPWVIEKKLLPCIILGGETGPGARPMHPDWVRSVRDQCKAAGVPFFFKQWGEWMPVEPMADDFPNCGYPPSRSKLYRSAPHDWDDYRYSVKGGRAKAGRLLDGRTHDDLPWRLASRGRGEIKGTGS